MVPPNSLLRAGLTELSHVAGLPVGSMGGCSDSKAVDGEEALEEAFSVWAAMVCGADLVHDAGYIEGGRNRLVGAVGPHERGDRQGASPREGHRRRR